MLALLRITNYAIIDDVEIEVRPGFSVMTGETGAGKSILVDALGLALGDRADATAVRSGTRRAEISAVFELDADHPAREWLAARDLDDEDICCLRRVVSAEGRSRAFVNNQPVTLKDLREIGGTLVDIHGQHAHQSLLTPSAQRMILDTHGKLIETARQVADAYGRWQTTARQLNVLTTRGENREAELQLLRFQLGELEAMNLSADEPSALKNEAMRLTNVDRLRQSTVAAADCLYESESGSAHALAAAARRHLERIVEHDADLAPLLERVAAIEIELQETGAELARRVDTLEADPARLEEVQERLGRIRELGRRHRVEDNAVPAVAEKLRAEMTKLASSAESAAELEARSAHEHQQYRELAASLSKSRHEAAVQLEAAVTARLSELGMPAAEFCVRIANKPDERCDSTGMDRITFEVSTNAGSAPGPVDRVASGGELSRIGLAIAVVAIDASTMPTLVFDEVDSGIGGAIAEVVGRRLKDLAKSHQVLCVTHLPQVASQGSEHYKIVKLTDGNSSRTQVRALNTVERIEELSRMLGGLKITDATRAHAAEMMRQAASA